MGKKFIPLNEYMEREREKYAGVLVPVRALMLERMLVKSVRTDRLHPNPDDEFCFPDVGPNYGIINDYERKFRQHRSMQTGPYPDYLIVQKVRPDGYMLLNGHHRWAAAMRVGFPRVPVKITNITQETDIRRMLQLSAHDRRVTMDLDEVIFLSGEDMPAEKPLRFPANRIYKERIRLGVPALMHLLSVKGYDLWVYSSRFHSLEYVKYYFKKYSVRVTGIITGMTGRDRRRRLMLKNTEKLFAEKYKETLHIDLEMVTRTFTEPGKYEEYAIKAEPAAWSQAAMAIVKGLDQHA